MSTAVQSPHATRPIRVIQPWRSGVRHRLWEVVRHRRVILYYGGQYVRRRYRNTWLGWIWLPLRPALQIGTQALFYGSVLKGGKLVGDRPYIIFFTFSSAAWVLFERTMYWANRAMRVSRSFTRNVHAPFLPKVMAISFAAAMDFLLAVWIAIAAVFYYWIVRGHLWLVPSAGTLEGFAGILLLGLWGFAIGLWLAPFSLLTRDVRYSWAYVMGFWYVITPVAYDVNKIPQKFQMFVKYNPLTGPLQMVGQGFIQTGTPNPTSLLVSIPALMVILAGGLWSFNRFERKTVSRL